MYDAKKEIYVERNRIKRLLDWINGKSTGPVRIDAEFHRRCNLKCLVCPRRAADIDLNKESAKHEMSLTKWLKIVKEAAKLGVLWWNIEGACEPLYLPKLVMPVMKKVKKVEMFGDLTTNGTLWTEEMVRKTVEMSWDRIHISIDAVDSKTHDELRQVPGAFEKAFQTAMMFKKIKKELQTDKPSIVINFVTNKKNYKQLPEIIKLAHKFGADYVFTEPVIVHSKHGEKLKLSSEQMKDLKNYINKAHKISKELDLGTNFTTEEKALEEDLVQGTSKIREVLMKRKQRRADKEKLEEQEKIKQHKLFSASCFKPWFNMAIKHNGDAGPCGLLYSSKENVKKKSLKNIWLGKYYTKVRQGILNDKLSNECARCAPSDVTQADKLREDLMHHTDKDYLFNEMLKWMNDFIRTEELYKRKLIQARKK